MTNRISFVAILAVLLSEPSTIARQAQFIKPTFDLVSPISKQDCDAHHGEVSKNGLWCLGPHECIDPGTGKPNDKCTFLFGCNDRNNRQCFGLPIDPNDKTGPSGVGLGRFLSGAARLPYEIQFENLPAATLPARLVAITDQLNLQNVDITTFSLGPISFGTTTVVPPPGLHHFTRNVDLRPAQNILVQIDAGLNDVTGLVTWRFTSIDPVTLQLTEDPTAGFLPPDTSPPAGEGNVIFNVSQKPGLSTGTPIQNQASVVFDLNAPIVTPVWTNTVDVTPPVSRVQALPNPETTTSFNIQWSGTDQGAGIQDFTIYVSKDNAGFAPVINNTTSKATTFTGIAGSTYRFYSIARDLVGNVESKTTADTFTQIVIPSADTTPPVTTTASSPQATANGWNNSNVTVTFAAMDETGGSGVKQITVSATGAQPIAPNTIMGGSLSVTINVEGTTTISFFATDNAGNAESAKTVTVRLDKTPPSITGSRTPDPNPFGWNNADVTVKFSCSDALSGLAVGSPPPDTVLSNEVSGQSVTRTCMDLAGNTASATVENINIDKTPPTASAGGAPAPNGAGWNNTNVSVAFSGADAISGIDSCSSPVAVTTDGKEQTVFGTCVDKAGNVSTPAVAKVSIDKMPPVITGSRSPATNSNGWNNGDVTVTFNCSDTLSGLAMGSPPANMLITAEGSNKSAAGTCMDLAGNTASVTVGNINIDKTPPLASAGVSPGPNANGWNKTDVTVTITGSDTLSGIDSCSAPVSLTVEGAGQTASGACTDKAGNASTPAVAKVNIDKTPPVAAAAISPAPDATGWNHTNVTVSFSGSDSLSGIDFCSAPVTLTMEGAGKVVSGTCSDKAGNISALVTVRINIDKGLPVISGMPAPGCALWPPNQKLVQVATITASAPGGIARDSFRVTATSNEPISRNDPRYPDIVITAVPSGGFTVQLRADRLGKDKDRIYTIIATAANSAGNRVTATAICTVPHDQSK